MTPTALRFIPALLVAVLGFALSVACIPGPLRSGTTAPRTVIPPPPAHGPWLARGGQRMHAGLPVDPAAAARSALAAAGWTATASTRRDEMIGSRRDNRAYVRWSASGWWVRVDQVSDFATGARVPPWDHPWEALRLLHRLAPHAGPALGWTALAPPAPQVSGAEAEALYRLLLREWLDGRLQAQDPRPLRLRDVLRADPTPGVLRERLAALARALGDGQRTACPCRNGPAELASTRRPADDVTRWSAERIDPYTFLPANTRIDERMPTLETSWATESTAICAERVVATLATGALVTEVTWMDWRRDEIALLITLGPPLAERLMEALEHDPPSGRAAYHELLSAWWRDAGQAWVERIRAEGR